VDATKNVLFAQLRRLQASQPVKMFWSPWDLFHTKTMLAGVRACESPFEAAHPRLKARIAPCVVC